MKADLLSYFWWKLGCFMKSASFPLPHKTIRDKQWKHKKANIWASAAKVSIVCSWVFFVLFFAVCGSVYETAVKTSAAALLLPEQSRKHTTTGGSTHTHNAQACTITHWTLYTYMHKTTKVNFWNVTMIKMCHWMHLNVHFLLFGIRLDL